MVDRSPKPSDLYMFKPKSEITAYELARLFEWMTIKMTPEAFASCPADLRKFFVAIERTAAIAGPPKRRG